MRVTTWALTIALSALGGATAAAQDLAPAPAPMEQNTEPVAVPAAPDRPEAAPPTLAAKAGAFDVGPLVTLRCAGGNGLFDTGPDSDDLVCVAGVVPPDIRGFFTVRYKFAGVVPMQQRCRFVRGAPPAQVNCP